jgi:hypothetical protein
VRLFCDRARSVQPFFELTDAIAPTVAAICRAVDGLPLAVELASVRAGMAQRPGTRRPAHRPTHPVVPTGGADAAPAHVPARGDGR